MTSSSFAVLLLLAAGAEAFSPTGGALSPSASPRAVTLLRGNDFSAEARAAARAAAAAGQSHVTMANGNVVRATQATGATAVAVRRRPTSPPVTVRRPSAPRPAAPAQPDGESVALVLQEFVQSDYARQLCDYCNVPGTDYGRLSAMFESVKLLGTTMEIKLAQRFEQRSAKLLDRLAKHLRTRMPQLQRLSYEHRTTTTTVIL